MLTIVMVSLAQNLRSSNIASDQMLYYLLSVSITIYTYVAKVNITFTSFASGQMKKKNPIKRPKGIPIPKPMIPKKVLRNPIF